MILVTKPQQAGDLDCLRPQYESIEALQGHLKETFPEFREIILLEMGGAVVVIGSSNRFIGLEVDDAYWHRVYGE